MIDSREELSKLFLIRALSSDVRIILVLPDTEEETIAMAHRSRPRYLTYINSNFLGLATVVSKMCEDRCASEVFQNRQHTIDG